MSVYEPVTMRKLLASIQTSAEKRTKYEQDWDKSVLNRVTRWQAAEKTRLAKLSKGKSGDSVDEEDDASSALSEQQMQWAAEVVEYVQYIGKATRVHGNSSAATSKVLDERIPILGPRFVPPPPLVVHARRAARHLQPADWYLRPLIIVHDFYYPGLRTCMVCGSGKDRTAFDGWASTVPRRVHGISTEEFAYGQQLRCENCKAQGSKPFCYATTSGAFWKKISTDFIPAGIPIFRAKVALTRDLFDLVVEQRLSSTAAGTAQAIKQLHLQQYFRDKSEYVALLHERQSSLDALRPLIPFSMPFDNAGYALAHVTADVLTDVYLDYNERVRKPESEALLRSLSGICLSIDATFKITNKATVVSADSVKRSRLLKGGLFSVINEHNLILSWRVCQTQAHAEGAAVLAGIEHRRKLLGAPAIEGVTSDECCKVRGMITSTLPDAEINLDTFHFVKRYTDSLAGGKKNACRGAIAKDITESVIELRANKRDGILTKYWPQEVQVARLIAAWAKWSQHEHLWQAGAAKVHEDQLNHVKRGCLARARNDIASDGSRIESSHKGWNSLMRSHASGLEMLTALGHDFVLRRNIRIASSLGEASPFSASTFGCHHIMLVDDIARKWNLICSRRASAIHVLPMLQTVDSGESFGLAWTEYSSLAPAIKKELADTFVFEVDTDYQNGIELLDSVTTVPVSTPPQAVQKDAIPSTASAAVSTVAIVPPLREQPAPFVIATAHTARTAVLSQHPSVPSTAAAVLSLQPPPPPPRTTYNAIPLNIPGPGSASPLPSALVATGKRQSGELVNTQPPKKARTESAAPQISTPARRLAPIFQAPAPLRASASATPQPRPTAQAAQPSTATVPTYHLTRSERLFKRSTGADPAALKLNDEEYFAFANFRVEHQLRTHEMTPARIVKFTRQFNSSLRAGSVHKDPRVILSTLLALEEKVLERLHTRDFISNRSGTDTFWKKQCEGFTITSATKVGTGTKARKPAVCRRCERLMYPNGNKGQGNHSRDFCSDGVPQKLAKDAVAWPQPEGVFFRGTKFDVPAFFAALKALDTMLESGTEKPLEYHRFWDMVGQRTVVENGRVYFRLFRDLELSATQGAVVDVIDGENVLCIGLVPPPASSS